MEEKMGSIEVGEILTLLDKDDCEQENEVIGLLTMEDKKYAAVAFVEEVNAETEENIDVFLSK